MDFKFSTPTQTSAHTSVSTPPKNNFLNNSKFPFFTNYFLPKISKFLFIFPPEFQSKLANFPGNSQELNDKQQFPSNFRPYNSISSNFFPNAISFQISFQKPKFPNGRKFPSKWKCWLSGSYYSVLILCMTYLLFLSFMVSGKLALLQPKNSILGFLFLVWPQTFFLLFLLYFGFFYQLTGIFTIFTLVVRPSVLKCQFSGVFLLFFFHYHKINSMLMEFNRCMDPRFGSKWPSF